MAKKQVRDNICIICDKKIDVTKPYYIWENGFEVLDELDKEISITKIDSYELFYFCSKECERLFRHKVENKLNVEIGIIRWRSKTVEKKDG